MRASTWLSDALDDLNPRERRVVVGGAIVSVAVLLLVFVIMPYARSWQEREAAIDLRQERLGRLTALVAAEDSLRKRAEAERDELRRREALLLQGGTRALAASDLQLLLQRYAGASPARLTRVEVLAGRDSVSGTFAPVSVRLTAETDVRGLTTFLRQIRQGETLLLFDEMRIAAGRLTDDGRQTLTLTARVRGFYGREIDGPEARQAEVAGS